jgi:hypothetical protein
MDMGRDGMGAAPQAISDARSVAGHSHLSSVHVHACRVPFPIRYFKLQASSLEPSNVVACLCIPAAYPLISLERAGAEHEGSC